MTNHHQKSTDEAPAQDIAEIALIALPEQNMNLRGEAATSGDALSIHDRLTLEEHYGKTNSSSWYQPALTRDHNFPYTGFLRTNAVGLAKDGFFVFPCRPVDSPDGAFKAKAPATANGFKGATDNPDKVEIWWRQKPDALIGVRTGLMGGIWVLDIDTKGADGIAALKTLEAKFGPLPETHMVRTPSGGVHYYFKMPDGVELKCSASKVAPGIDVRAEGGYVIAPPSKLGDGRSYETVGNGILLWDAAWAPQWLIDLALHGGSEKAFAKIASRGWAYKLLAKRCEEVAKAEEGSRNETLNKCAFAVGILVGQNALDRQAAFDALMEAAKKCGLDNNEARTTIDSGLGSGAGEKSDAPQFPDWTRYGPQRDSLDNCRALLSHIGVKLRYNEFANRGEIEGFKSYTKFSDNAVDEFWGACHEFGFQPSQNHLRASLRTIALESSFNPVRDYFDGLTWDGVKRLDGWLTAYLGASDSDYIQHVGAKMLIAAVRRIYRPGVKFDQMVILEGAQGTGKSSALKILAIQDQWFSDSFTLKDDERKVLEQSEGKFIIEIAELAGMRKAEMEHFKSLLSRTEDRARKAYGYFRDDVPRQFIFVGTTNGGEETPYLLDPSGNRRAWPVKTGKIDLASLRRDVDQLYAEAVHRHKAGESIELPQRLWDAARLEQEKRALEDPWEMALDDGFGEMRGKVLAEDVWAYLGKADASKRSQWDNNNLGRAMKKLGWERKKLRHDGKPRWHYIRGAEPFPHIEVLTDGRGKPTALYQNKKLNPVPEGLNGRKREY